METKFIAIVLYNMLQVLQDITRHKVYTRLVVAAKYLQRRRQWGDQGGAAPSLNKIWPPSQRAGPS